MVSDARYTTKTWITTYWVSTNVTEDDGETNATIVCMYAYPDYPLTREFIDNSIDGLILVHEPNSTPLKGHDQYVTHYRENVDIEIATINKTGITSVFLLQKMKAELRRIFETYPFGSLRLPTSEKPTTTRIGGTTIDSFICTLSYTRDKTV